MSWVARGSAVSLVVFWVVLSMLLSMLLAWSKLGSMRARSAEITRDSLRTELEHLQGRVHDLTEARWTILEPTMYRAVRIVDIDGHTIPYADRREWAWIGLWLHGSVPIQPRDSTGMPKAPEQTSVPAP